MDHALPSMVTRKSLSGWQIAKLGEVARYINGRAFKPDEWSKTGLPIIRIENLNSVSAPFNYFDGELSDAHRVSDGDLLISWSASLDAFIWNRGPAALNQHIFKVLVDETRVSRYFLYYAAKSVMQDIRAKVHGATMAHITKGEFEAIAIPLPPIPEQERIVAILNEQMARTEEVRSQIAQQIESADAITSSILHAVFESSEACMSPHKPIGDFTKTTSGATPSRGNPAYFANGTIPWVKTGELKDNLITQAEEHVTEQALRDCSLPLLPEGTLLVAMYGQGQTRGRTGLLAIPATTNQACFAILPNSSMFESRYLQYWFRHSYEKLRRETENRGGNQPNLNGILLRGLEVPLPPMEKQREIAEKLDLQFAIAREISGKQQQVVSSIDTLPTAFLRRAFSGSL